MKQVPIKPGHLKYIAENVTSLIKHSDNRRLDFLKLLLTIYTPVTSVLFIGAKDTIDLNVIERFSYLSVSTTSALIVLTVVFIFIFYFLISENIAKKYVEKVNESGENYSHQLTSKKWHSYAIQFLTFTTVVLFIGNVLSAITYIYAAVLGYTT